MKVGILTFHFACNYGAVLQCYALQKYLMSRGHEVYVMDYRPDAVAGGYRWFDIRRFWGSDPVKFYRKTVSELGVIADRRRRYTAFDDFVRNHLPLTPSIRSLADAEAVAKGFDLIVVGSDQVWNPRITGGVDPVYWGGFTEGVVPMASYAASMEDGFSDEVKMAVKKYLPSFRAISVREEALKSSLDEILPDADVRTAVDPTLLADAGIWDVFADCLKPEDPYVLFYQVRRSPEAWATARALADSRGLRLLCLSAKVELENSPEVISSSPEEFVSLFRNASYVVTTSFHGTVFSILFRKPFACVDVHDGKGTRQEGLLKALGLSGRMVAHGNLEGLPGIDWDDVAGRLSALRHSSEEYIKSCGL